MTADNPGDFPYEPVCGSGDAARREARWNVARGLQQVDGLSTSSFLAHVAAQHIEGACDIQQAGTMLRAYYRERGHRPHLDTCSNFDPRTEEADLVSHRIVELLERGAFLLDSAMLFDIHQTLFQDLDPSAFHPGKCKTGALQKRELVLNGDSVVYADPSLVDRALTFVFDDERDYSYSLSFDSEQLSHFARFVSRLWQVHPFCEGNTRTVAVFAVLYLRFLGFDIDNEPFRDHSAYFRDALVRANYRNARAGVMPDTSFIEFFFDNVLNEAHHTLQSRDLMVQALYDQPSLLRNVDPSEAIVSKS